MFRISRDTHDVRCRGGARKFRALKLEQGNFSWGSEAVTRKTRILVVVYNASNNELVRTNTLVKNAIIQIDASPFRTWYEQHYGLSLSKTGKGLPKRDEKVEAGKEGAKATGAAKSGAKGAKGAKGSAKGGAKAAEATTAKGGA